MDIYRAERLAQDRSAKDRNWDKSFKIVGPNGEIECEWLDPYFGMFQFKGKEGFVMTKQVPADLDVIMPEPTIEEALAELGLRAD
jgi:hypothetical protein